MPATSSIGTFGIDAVLVEEIDAVGPEPLERGLGDLPDVLRPAVHAALSGRPVDVDAELGGDHHLVADRLQRFADDLFVRVRAIDLGGVEEGDAALEGRPDQADRIRRLHRLAVGLAHPHAAEADGRDFEAAVSEFALLHCRSPSESGQAPYCVVADLLHPVDGLAVERSWMAMWVMAVVGAAPCQCFSPGANQTTSPGRISSIGPPRAAPGRSRP